MSSYKELCEVFLGYSAKYIVNGAMILAYFGSMISYFVSLGILSSDIMLTVRTMIIMMIIIMIIIKFSLFFFFFCLIFDMFIQSFSLLSLYNNNYNNNYNIMFGNTIRFIQFVNRENESGNINWLTIPSFNTGNTIYIYIYI